MQIWYCICSSDRKLVHQKPYVVIFLKGHVFILENEIKIKRFTPGQKYKTTLKNEEKDIVYYFEIMKIRYMKDKYMKDKIKRHLNLN